MFATTRLKRRMHGRRDHSLPCLLMILFPLNGAVVASAGTPIDGNKSDGRLLAGAATSNITPQLGVSINGGMHDRTATHVHDELHARAVVLNDGRTRLAIVTCDSCVIPSSVFDKAKQDAQEHTGIPASHMLMSATHAHSAPTIAPVFQSEPDPAYPRFLSTRITDAVRRAANQLEPAVIGWGVGQEPKHVFNRRWHMTEGAIGPNPFGQATDKVQMNPARGSADLVEPAGPTDPAVAVLAIRSQAGRPIAVLANYALHYVGGVPGDHISADYFGAFADRMQQLAGADRLDPPFVGMLTNGSSGNINNINFRVKPDARQPYEQLRIVANDLAAEALEVMRELRYRDRIILDARETRIALGVRRPDTGELQRAERIIAGKAAEDAQTLEEIYAIETIAMEKYPSSVEVVLQAMRIGEVGIVAIPCEVFVEIGLELKQKSPFAPTVIVELANGYNGYLPTPDQYKLGGYETWRARSSYLEADAAPKIVDTLIAMLNDMSRSCAE